MMMRAIISFVALAALLPVSATAQTPPAYVDTHVHLRAKAEALPAALNVAQAAMDKAGISAMILEPQPFPAETLPNKHDGDDLIPVTRRFPGKFWVVSGGGSLNGMLLSTPPQAVDEATRQHFRMQAKQVAQSGVKGFGEISVLHLSHFPSHPFEEIPADHPLLMDLADVAARHDMPVDIHMDVVEHDIPVPAHLSAISNQPRLNANLPAFERLLAAKPQTRFILAHAGWDPIGHWNVALSRRLLTEHPNLFMSLKLARSGAQAENAPMDGDTLKPEWRDLLTTFPDRFVIGSDSFFAPEKAGYAAGWTDFNPGLYGLMLAQLPLDVAQRIASDNAGRLFHLTSGPATEAGTQAKFNAWDSDGDQRISAEEWQGPPPRFKKLDKNGDGFVDFDEFNVTPPDAAPPRPAMLMDKPQPAAKDPVACDKCQQEWQACMVGKAGFVKQRCDEAMFRCQNRCQ